MEDDGNDEQSKFLSRLENVNPYLIENQMENFYASDSPWMEAMLTDKSYRSSLQSLVDGLEEGRRKSLPQGMDLGDVKHYSYSELSEFTDDIHENFFIGETTFGRFLRGRIQQGSVTKDVVIKKLDLFGNPLQEFVKSQPRRFHNEIICLTKMKLVHRHLPRLIGFSIDKKLVVVYDMKPGVTLNDALKRDKLLWKDRLEIAIQVARLLKYFHKKKITIGSIDAMNILIDEENVIKLCAFGLTVRMTVPVHEMDPINSIMGRYASLADNLHAAEGKWTEKSDVFAFGHLLLALINRKRLSPDETDIWVWELHREGTLVLGEINLVDESLLNDGGIGRSITKLALECLKDEPSQIPTAEFVVRELKKFRGAKKQKLFA